jgi:BlaI family transcriptional regulator, penicillinase repressor
MQLTKAEEQIMQILWDRGGGLVREIREKFDDPKPARNTVSTVLRVLESKGFVSHESLGNVHRYFPVLSKEEYSKKQLFRLLGSYFDDSFSAMASFFAREKDLSVREMEEILEEIKKEIKTGKKRK